MSASAYKWQNRYVKLMMAVVGRSLISAAKYDPEISRELANLPDEFGFGMRVWPDGAGFSVIKKQGKLTLLPADSDVPLLITFKHIKHAFLVLSFQENTAQAFANDRMILEGEVAQALAVVRILNRMQSLILPRAIAARAVKRYPTLPLAQKLPTASKIYAGFLVNLIKGH